jgi:hypothetical protein
MQGVILAGRLFVQMTDPRDDLSPSEGVSDVFLEFDGMKTRLGSPHGDVTFRFVQRRGGQEAVIATMSFPVQAGHDGHPGMMVRAYDQLIAALRQSLFYSSRARAHYRNEAQLHYPVYPTGR